MLILSDLLLSWFTLSADCVHFCAPSRTFEVLGASTTTHGPLHRFRRRMNVSLRDGNGAVAHELHYSERVSSCFPETYSKCVT